MRDVATETLGADRRRVAVVTFIAVLANAACFDHSRDWNSASRFLLTHAVVDQGTIEVSVYVSHEGKILADPPTRDLARDASGRYFCDKAPGQSLLGAIPYAAWRAMGGEGAKNIAGRPEASDYWVTLGTSGVALAGAASIVAATAVRWGAGPLAATVVAIAMGFGTHAAVYGTLFYGHVLAGFFMVASLVVFAGPDVSRTAAFISGLLAALAIAVEYPSALFSTAMVLVHGTRVMMARGRGSGFVIAFVAGHLAPLAALGYYHWHVTGSPIQVPYSLEVEEQFAYHRQGFGMGLHAPDWQAAWNLIASPTRGLLFYAPILIGAIPGLWILGKTRGSAAIVIALTSAGMWLLIAGFPAWHGGLGTGPRLFVSVAPLLSLPIPIWLSSRRTRWGLVIRGAWILVAIASTVWITLLNAAGGRFAVDQHPWTDYVLEHARNGSMDGFFGAWIARDLGFASPTAALAVQIAVTLSIGAVALVIVARSDVSRRVVRISPSPP